VEPIYWHNDAHATAEAGRGDAADCRYPGLGLVGSSPPKAALPETVITRWVGPKQPLLLLIQGSRSGDSISPETDSCEEMLPERIR
jgi:hypothetical protein